MLITVDFFSKVSGKPVNDNMVSALRGLQFAGDAVGLAKPHRLAMFMGQTGHESAGWRYDREIWGPTTAQNRYEGRADLGNTQKGDGSKFRGYTPMQITGRYNTTKFYNWCVKTFPNLKVPNFVNDPSLMNTDPWEGIGPLWYWAHGKPASLNVTADRGDFIGNTKLVNGGTNGLDDRYRYYGRAALVLLGRDPNDVAGFQRHYGLKADGKVGAITQAKMHQLLFALPEVKFNEDKTVTTKSNSILDFVMSILKLFTGK